jgi:FtsP/CotA-like multicopper oxidase with cupredoxin domain
MHLFIQEGPPHGRAPRALGFVVERDGRRPRPDSVEIPGSLLVMQRGQPTDIVVINRLKEPASIHWHGIELESYSDGVSGWSGAGDQLAPSIMPGDSFVAHLTLPRAGTFIYHTHLNDLEQLSSGLYGAIVVLEPEQRFDQAHDHVYVVGWDGPVPDPIPSVIVNGDSTAAPLHLEAGVPHRFRFVNIGIALPVLFRIVQDTVMQQWRRLAKDGADLPAGRQVVAPSRQSIQVGETYDFELTPKPGEYTMIVSSPQKVFFTQRLVVQ